MLRRVRNCRRYYYYYYYYYPPCHLYGFAQQLHNSPKFTLIFTYPIKIYHEISPFTHSIDLYHWPIYLITFVDDLTHILHVCLLPDRFWAFGLWYLFRVKALKALGFNDGMETCASCYWSVCCCSCVLAVHPVAWWIYLCMFPADTYYACINESLWSSGWHTIC